MMSDNVETIFPFVIENIKDKILILARCNGSCRIALGFGRCHSPESQVSPSNNSRVDLPY